MADQGLCQSSYCQGSAAPNNFQLTRNFNAVLKFAAIAPEDFSQYGFFFFPPNAINTAIHLSLECFPALHCAAMLVFLLQCLVN